MMRAPLSEQPNSAPGDVTRLLAHLTGLSRERALEQLIPIVYSELRVMARGQLRNERAGHSLQATALVHEAYLRLLKDDASWESRAHFFHAAAEAMRRILIEHARKRARQKRGGGRQQVSLASVYLAVENEPETLLALDDAIRRLEEKDARAGEVVRLRFFAGLSVEETAHTLGMSERTVKREWAVARAWLYRVLSDAQASDREAGL